ncbi:MAG: hypothetical protein ACTSQ6_11585 [Candidatus Heimdallarchaeaceae archaeon]
MAWVRKISKIEYMPLLYYALIKKYNFSASKEHYCCHPSCDKKAIYLILNLGKLSTLCEEHLQQLLGNF